jgi:16S rRNA (cytosine1402-N4)-methyltransferase
MGRICKEVASTMNTYHVPILVTEVLEGLRIQKGKRYIDATTGGGGHTVAMLMQGAVVLGLDADQAAVDFTRKRIREELPEAREKTEWKLVQGNFRDIQKLATHAGFKCVSGVLFDLGVSSRQLDSETKGFTYRCGSGKLDMRFDQAGGITAEEVIRTYSTEDLYEIFSKFGEEERAGAIAHAVSRARSVKRITSVADFVSAIRTVVPNEKELNGVLSRIFQALRIAVNDEFEALRSGLAGAADVLEPGGRIAVLSFHSLEDRIVKQYFRNGRWRVISKKPITAGEQEQTVNRRARSAKLRIAEKI